MGITDGDWLTFIAASAAVAVSVGSWISTHHQLNTHHARESWFERFSLAVDQMFDENDGKKTVGVLLMTTLTTAKWASQEDRVTALQAANAQQRRVEDEY